MPVGISTMLYEIDRSIDYLEKFNFVKHLGLKYIELSDAFHFQKNILNALAEDNLNVFSIHADYIESDISSLDEKKRFNGIDDALKRVDYLNKLKGKLLVIHPGGWYPDKKEKDERIKNCINSLVYIAKKASLNGIKIAVENLPTEFFGDDIGTVSYILNKARNLTNNKDIGICLDIGHAFLTGNIFDYLSLLYDDILTIHLHDNNGDNNGNRAEAMDDLHAVPGTGLINWKNIFDVLSERNYKGGLIFEVKKGSKSLEQVIGEIKYFIDSNLFLKQNI